MFKQFKYKIVATFTLTHFALTLLLGGVLLIVEYHQIRSYLDQKNIDSIARLAFVYEETNVLEDAPATIYDIKYVRIFDSFGEQITSGAVFQEDEIENDNLQFIYGPRTIAFGSERYRVMGLPIDQEGTVVAYVEYAQELVSLYRFFQENLSLIAIVALLTSFIMLVVGLKVEEYLLQPIRKKQASLQNYTYNAGHELRTPLAAIQSSLEVAQLTKDYQEGVENSLEQVQSLSMLVTTLMELESIQLDENDRQPVNMSKLVEDIVLSLQPLAKESDVTLVPKITPNVLKLGNTELVTTMLTNLVQNAIKFSGKQKEVVITVKETHVAVTDKGVGMSPEIQERIFDRFFKADISRNQRGYGLGLSIVQRIAEVHNWNVTVQSKVRKGSTFTVHFS